MEKNNVDTIHVKIIHDDQIRRFLFAGTEFTSLKETISKLLNFNDQFVLKYQDDEKDYVILENQEDLDAALSISPKLLRISVEKKGALPSSFGGVPPSSVGGSPPSVVGVPPSSVSGGCDEKMKYRKRHGGPHHHRERPNNNPEWKKQRAEKKLAWINQCLADLADESKLAPRDLWKKQRLLKKQQKLETFVREGNFGKRERKVLTPEEEQLNCGIKLQILEIKAEAAKVKGRTRELKIVLQSKPGDQGILAELATLKERKGQLRTQKKSLWEQLHS
jgi:hypothetical protein